jgi:MerR family transcriptional regulator, heat shock protein HspR
MTMRIERRTRQTFESSPGRRPVYHISIVAEMVETHPQTLRMYERMGLISPQRTRNNIRLYSDEDVEMVRRIQHLTQDLGVNLAGVEVVFKLLGEMERMRAQFEEERQQLLRAHNGNGENAQEAAPDDAKKPRVIEVQTRKKNDS